MMERFDMLIFFGQNQNAAYDQLIWKIAIQVNITINNIFVSLKRVKTSLVPPPSVY
jgi:hypothetical protein